MTVKKFFDNKTITGLNSEEVDSVLALELFGERSLNRDYLALLVGQHVSDTSPQHIFV